MKLNRFDISFWLGLVIWLVETACFGWNVHAQSSLETFFDTLSGGLILYGVAGNIVISAVREVLKAKETTE